MMGGNTTRALDRADEEIDRFIERRAAEREKINAEAEEWRASEKRYERQRHEDYRIEWMNHYLKLAEIHDQLAEQSRERAWSLDG